MSASVSRIQELLAQVDRMPVGPEERALIDEAVRLADEEGAQELAYAARLRLTASAHMAGDTDAMFAAFAWCVGTHDADPARFPLSIDGNDLLWQYKWMARRLSSNPAIPLARVDDLHADMSRRYREAGTGQSGVLQSRHESALLAGDIEAAARYLAERDELPRDDYSHCEACVRSSDAAFARLRGDDETALRLYDEIIEQDLSCGEEPEAAEGEALLPLLRAGRVDDARAAHLRASRAARANPDGFAMIADHLRFCAVTGNLSRGLAMLERHLPQLGRDPLAQAEHMISLAKVAVLLDALVEDGHADTLIARSDAPELVAVIGGDGRLLTAAELAAAARRTAADIARAFDERGGTSFHADRLEDIRLSGADRFDVAIDTPVFTPEVPVPDEPRDAEGWLLRARDTIAHLDLDVPAAAAARVVDDPDAGPRELAGAQGVLAQIALRRGAPEEAIRLIERRGENLRRDGRDALAEVESRIGSLLFGETGVDDEPVIAAELASAIQSGADDAELPLRLALSDLLLRTERPEPALEQLETVIARLDDDDPHRMLPSARLLGSFALLGLSRFDELADRLDDLLAEDATAPVRMQALYLRAQLLGGSGRSSEGARAADESLTLAIPTRDRARIISTARLAASLLADAGQGADAVARLEFAISEARRGELDTTTLRFELGRAQVRAGTPDLGLDTLDEVYQAEIAAGADDVSVAATLHWLGEAALASDDPRLAFGAWSDAVDRATSAEAWQLAAEVGSRLGQLLSDVESEDAVEVLEAALTAAGRSGLVGLVADVRHRLGRAKTLGGDESGLEDLDAVIRLAAENDAAWLHADATDSKGRALLVLGRVDDGLAVLLGAA
ncbi:MAG: hypothetical protein ABW040_08775, partial [Microbacteriaceae bacterium]